MSLALLALLVFAGSYCITAAVMSITLAVSKRLEPLPAYGWPDPHGTECEACGDQEEDQGEDVEGAEGDPEEPEQSEDGRGDVADEGDHGAYLPDLKGG